jgi:cytochrome b subunit of formate dehydrogenase
MSEQATPSVSPTYTRFTITQRIEHIVFLVSFSTLGATGLIQKYAQSPLSQSIIASLGGIEITRLIHHSAAFVMMLVTIFHIINLLYRVIVLRVPWTMMPVIEDIKHLYEDVMYYLGRRQHKAFYGRYNYAEKAEYLAVVWGTVIMGITGFMMWNPITTTRYLPGQFIPAAKVAHGMEAVLAILAIVIWHFYHVHVRHLNKSIFTGKISETEMGHEHPAELAQIKAGEAFTPPPADVIRKRQRIYYPIAILLAIIMSLGVVAFVSMETTAITTIPPAETAPVLVQVTTTPAPTPSPTQTTVPGGGIEADTWDGKYSALFRNRCSTCHGMTKVGGLSLANYESALAGGNSGPGIVPGDSEGSMIVQMQQIGNHPGQLTDEELQDVINWINAGAPEN